jgi:hypothetical protein
MTGAFTGAVLALIVFVITQSILKFIIEPIQDQKKVIGEIANAFVAYADVPVDLSPKEFYGKTEGTSAQRERVVETRQELRKLSGRLRASLWAIPLYKGLSRVKLVPKVAAIDEASDGLIGWSNTLVRTDASDQVRKYQDTVSEKLGITKKYEQLRDT